MVLAVLAGMEGAVLTEGLGVETDVCPTSGQFFDGSFKLASEALGQFLVVNRHD
jgi:hypothetical protein